MYSEVLIAPWHLIFECTRNGNFTIPSVRSVLRHNISSRLCHIGRAVVLGSSAVQWQESPVCAFAQLIRMDVGAAMS